MFRFALFLFYESEAGPIIQYINKMGDYVFFVLFFAKCEYSTYIVEKENVMCLLNTKDMDAKNKQKRDHLQLILKGHYAMLRGGNSENW